MSENTPEDRMRCIADALADAENAAANLHHGDIGREYAQDLYEFRDDLRTWERRFESWADEAHENDE